jgi:hypothetical protein
VNFSGTIASGQSCTNTLSGALTCVSGTTCMAGTCQP